MVSAMKNSSRYFCSGFFRVPLFSLISFLTIEAQAIDDSNNVKDLSPKQIPLSTHEAYLRTKDLFHTHVIRHQAIIYPDSKEHRETFKIQLDHFVKDLKVLKGQALLLRATAENSNENLLDALLDLPRDYIILKILAEANEQGVFESNLEYIESKWLDGLHFNSDSVCLNVFERQRRTLEVVRHDIDHMYAEYALKMEKAKQKTEALMPTLEILKDVLSFASTNKTLIECLEQERLDFVCLCQLIFPVTREPLDNIIASLHSLVTSYTPAPLAIPLETTPEETSDPSCSSENPSDQSSPKRSIRRLETRSRSFSESDPSDSDSPRADQEKKGDKASILTKMRLGHKKNENAKGHPKKVRVKKRRLPKPFKRSSSTDTLINGAITPKSPRSNQKGLEMGHIHLPSPLPIPKLDSPTREQTKAPRGEKNRPPQSHLPLSKDTCLPPLGTHQAGNESELDPPTLSCTPLTPTEKSADHPQSRIPPHPKGASKNH